MNTKNLNLMVYNHLKIVDKKLAKELKRDANISGNLPPGSLDLGDLVKYFKETATEEMKRRLVPVKGPFCPYCLRTFAKRKNRNLHVKVIHEQKTDKSFYCKVCKKNFMSKVALTYHKDVCHSESSCKVSCEVCGQIIGHSVSLKRHMMSHEDKQKEYKCNECESVFTRKDNLQLHKKKIHGLVSIKVEMVEVFRGEGDKFKCQICHEVFAGPKGDQKLIAHLARKCKSRQQWDCNDCKKNFSTKFNLDQHRRVFHDKTHQSPLSCEICDFVTNHKTSLARHVKRWH
jgi:hypothetical protein